MVSEAFLHPLLLSTSPLYFFEGVLLFQKQNLCSQALIPLRHCIFLICLNLQMGELLCLCVEADVFLKSAWICWLHILQSCYSQGFLTVLRLSGFSEGFPLTSPEFPSALFLLQFSGFLQPRERE